MKIAILIFYLSYTAVNAQIRKIRVKKPINKVSLVQSESPWHVTFCNYYNGPITKVELFNSRNNLKISNNTIGLRRIIRFELLYKIHGNIYSRASSGDSIPLEVRNELIQIDTKSNFFICDIKAASKYLGTVLLNPITLKVIE